MNNKLNKIVESYKNSTMNKIRLSYNLKNHYNLNEIQRLILLTKI
jgi:hypothetical protein